MFGAEGGDRMLRAARAHREHVEAIAEASAPGWPLVADLLANARRRIAEGRQDDAVARLYRAIEATAQVALRERHDIADTGAVPLDALPEDLRARCATRAEAGTVKLGLQDAYALLRGRGDPAGERFFTLGLATEQSPLSARNQSILAHGFQPVGAKVTDALWQAALALSELAEDTLPVFPVLDPSS